MNARRITAYRFIQPFVALGLLAGFGDVAPAREDLPELVVTATRVPIHRPRTAGDGCDGRPADADQARRQRPALSRVVVAGQIAC